MRRCGSLVMLCTLAPGGCFDPSTSGTDETDDTGGSTGQETGPGSSGASAASATASTTASTTAGMSTTASMTSTGDETGPPPTTCNSGEPLGCRDGDLLICNEDGTGEESSPCELGCSEAELRCLDVDPSNGLADFLDDARGEDPLDLGAQAQIDTDDGTVTVDGVAIPVTSAILDGQPQVRVFVVGSLVTQEVTVVGTPALAIVSDGPIQISGPFSLSATSSTPGPGALNDPECQGGDQIVDGTGGNTAASGAGGGGFGTVGGNGGTATANSAQAPGGAAGGTIGNATLTPLRGGCDAGVVGASLRGAGGGGVQLVSRDTILVQGILSANGSSASGGGSGGGILLEAPNVQVSGNVVANGGAGAGGGFIPAEGEDGRTDDQPALGGPSGDSNLGQGGNGAAGNVAATAGQNINFDSGLSTDLNFAGHGGGGVGRIRVNTITDGLVDTGIFSPTPTTGPIGTR
jgi:hypothetical protein